MFAATGKMWSKWVILHSLQNRTCRCLLPMLMWLGISSNKLPEATTERPTWTKIPRSVACCGISFLYCFVFLSSVFFKEIASYTLVVAIVGIGLSINIKDILIENRFLPSHMLFVVVDDSDCMLWHFCLLSLVCSHPTFSSNVRPLIVNRCRMVLV